MSSILTNTAALSALQTLRNTNMQLDATQNRVSTGLKVASASDNAAYWSIATTMRSDSAVMSTIADSLGLSSAQTDTAYQGMKNAIELVGAIKDKLFIARSSSVDKAKVNTEISALKTQLQTGAKASSFNGQNWLYNNSATAPGVKEIVGSFNRDSAGKVSVGVLTVDTATTMLVDTNTANRGFLTKGTDVNMVVSGVTTTTTASYYLLNANSATTATGGATPVEIKIDAATTDDKLAEMISAVEKIMVSMTDAASVLGSTTTAVSKQGEFILALKSSIDRGIGSLVDADMNEESSKLKALQTQQQLGIQALTIANNNSANVLALFR